MLPQIFREACPILFRLDRLCEPGTVSPRRLAPDSPSSRLEATVHLPAGSPFGWLVKVDSSVELSNVPKPLTLVVLEQPGQAMKAAFGLVAIVLATA